MSNFFLKKLNAVKILDIFILLLVFWTPLVWSKYLNANYVSAKFFIFYFLTSFSLFVSSRHLKLPRLPRTLAIAFTALAILHLSSPLISLNWTDIFYLFKFLGFCFAFYYFYQLNIDLENFFKRYCVFFGVFVFLLLAFPVYEFYNTRIVQQNISIGLFLATFGNVNMFAEFLLLFLPFLHFWLGLQTKTPIWVKTILLSIWIFFIFYCRSRSAWIGLFLWFAWTLYKKKLTKGQFAAMVVALLLYQVAVLAPHVVQDIVDVKSSSYQERMHLYQSTVELIKDNPWGVRVGHFLYEIVPYMMDSGIPPAEYGYFDQPHSEILKWGAQFGWLGMLLSVGVLGYLFFILVFRSAPIEALKMNPQIHFFLSSSLIVLLPEICFQFPFENPASLLYLAFVFAVYLSTYPVLKVIPINFKKRFFIFLLACVGIVHSVFYVTSILMETSNNGDIDLVLYSCEAYPVNINACFNKNHFLLQNNNLVQMRVGLQDDLERFPYHAGLLRLLPLYLKNKGSDKQACEAILVYNLIFKSQKFYAQDVLQQCAGFQIPLAFQNAHQFKSDFLKWKNSLFN